MILGQCIYTTQGVQGGGNGSPLDVLNALTGTNGKTHTVNGVSVTGWKVLLPILSNDPSSCNSKGNTSSVPGCFYDQDPGTQAKQPWYQVLQFAEVIITSVDYPNDKAGFYVVGTGPPNGANTSTIACNSCNSPFPGHMKAVLVK